MSSNTSVFDMIQKEIQYCDTQIFELSEEMHQLNQDKAPLDMRLRECERAIKRFRLQLIGAYEARTRMNNC